MADVLDKELDTYNKKLDHLLANAEGKFVLIHEDTEAGVFESQVDAIAEGYKEFGNVPFLVKQVVKVEVPQNFVSNLLAV